MKNTHNLLVQNKSNPTQGGETNTDQLARLWVEMMLQHLQNTDSRFLKKKFIKLNK